MKRKSYLFIAILGLAAIFSSCDDEIESTAVVVDETKTAELKLYVRAELNTNNPGLEAVPEGTEFIVSIMNEDLNPNVQGTSRWSTTVSTGSGGILNVTVPTVDDGVTVYITASGFEQNYLVDLTTQELRYYFLNDYDITGVLPGTLKVEVVEIPDITIN